MFIHHSSSQLESGHFHCPQCRKQCSFILTERRRYLALFFVPVAPWGKAERLVECQECNGSYPERIRHYTADGDDTAENWHEGDRVLALWPAENYWYPATVLAVNADDIEIAYDDGDHASLAPDQVKALDIDEGDVVYARSQGEPFYRRATVLIRKSAYLKLRFDDGETENSTLSAVRVMRGQRWNRGDRVMAPWEPDFLYPGVVHSANDEFVKVQFDDGDQAELPMGSVLALNINVGELVFARRDRGQEYHPAIVTEKEEENICVEYEDDDTEWTTVSMVRIFVVTRQF